jgi:hypothetical protein
MRTLYTHMEDDAYELRMQTGTQPDEPKLRITLDAPGERAVSHDYWEESELAGLLHVLATLTSTQSDADG